MVTSTAIITTPLAARYMSQLCKHFAHKMPVELTETSGRIEFESGVVHLAATDEILNLRAEATDPAMLERVEQVAARHLVRFAFRDDLAINWTATAS